jgi:hypothetical protein
VIMLFGFLAKARLVEWMALGLAKFSKCTSAAKIRIFGSLLDPLTSINLKP